MSREVRKVPKDWQHPKNGAGVYLALGTNFVCRVKEWEEEFAEWSKSHYLYINNEDWKERLFCEDEMANEVGARPIEKDYMPTWTAEEATHYMMYQITSEGTPISPAFETPEELAQWLFDNKVGAFANLTAGYEWWLRIAKDGYAPRAEAGSGILKSGGDEKK